MDDLFGMDDAARQAPGARRGRGALSNRVGRYERQTRTGFDDGWDGGWEDGDDPPPPLRTRLIPDASRSIIARNTSPDIPFDRSINPYRGCEHGCTYCFARPSHAHLGFSAGLDFETKIMVKRDAPALLEAALRRRGYAVAPIAMGTNTDPYQPVEKDEGIMRGILEVLRDHRHPFSITTKGALIARDLDILGEMGRAGLCAVGISLTTLDNRLSRAMEPRAASPQARLRMIAGLARDLDILGEMGRAGLCAVGISLTTLDNRLSRAMEPRAASPQARLRMIAGLARAGVPTGVMIAPVVPALTDHETEKLLEAAAAAGAQWARWIALRLPLEVEGLFREWLEEAVPDRAGRVMNRVRELHGGQAYDPQWGRRMTGQGVWSALIRRRFDTAAKRLKLNRPPPKLRCDLFRVPPKVGDQLDLF